MSYVKYTKTSTFLFPLLEIPKELFQCNIKNSFNQVIMTTRFLNSYLHDSDLDCSEYNDGPFVYIIVKPYQDIEFDTFYSTIISFDNYIDEYHKNNFIIMIFEITSNNLKDYEKIINGCYSTLSKEAKSLIMKNSFFSGKPFTIPLILNKAENLKNSWEKRLSNDGIINKGLPDERYVGIDSLIDLGEQEVWSILDIEKESITDDIFIGLNKKRKLQPIDSDK